MTDKPEQLALAVINDGSTYDDRLKIIAEWLKPEARKGNLEMRFFLMARAESVKPCYEGIRFTREDCHQAATQIRDYMRQHHSELES